MSDLNTCPGCGTSREGGDEFCGACGRRFEDQTAHPVTSLLTAEANAPAAAAPAPTSGIPDSPTVVASELDAGPDADLRTFPWWQLIVFGIASFGLWKFYWFYCTRKQLNHLLRYSETRPGLDTFGLAVPIWQAWCVNGIFRDVGRLARTTSTGNINNTTYTVIWCIFYYVPFINYLGIIVIPILYVLTQIELTRSLTALGRGTVTDRPVSIWSAIIGLWGVVAVVLYALL